MRSNALKKEDFFENELAVIKTEGSAPKAWETRRREIALASEVACNLPGNLNVPDYEAFLVSDFA